MNRKRPASILPLVLLSALSAACASSGGGVPEAAESAAPTPAPERVAASAPMASTTAASFTAAQADRGRDVFRAQCTECHYSSEFSDSQFKFKWSRRTAGSLFDLIQTQMPETAPGSLSPEQAVDIVSYVLRMNGFEPGSSELAADPDALDAISLASIRD